MLCRDIRRPQLKQFEQVSGVRHLALDARMHGYRKRSAAAALSAG